MNITQTPHELWYGETPSVKHFKKFGSKCYIKNNDEQLGKLEPRADEGILLGYSPHSKAYKCYNKRLERIVDSIDVVVDEEGNIPRQVNYENIKEDEDYPSNQTDDEEEPQEAPEEQIRIEEKTPTLTLQERIQGSTIFHSRSISLCPVKELVCDVNFCVIVLFTKKLVDLFNKYREIIYLMIMKDRGT